MATRVFPFGAGLAMAVAMTLPAIAGPPLICHSFEINGAKSLPWTGSADWRGVDKDYDLSRLTADTLALLQPETPVLVRMEALRRATVYAVWGKTEGRFGTSVKGSRLADDLLAKLMARAKESPAALFDAGYLMASLQQATYESSTVDAVAAYEMVRKAAEAAHSAEMEFAAALMTSGLPRSSHEEHLRRARAGADSDGLLAKNLSTHIGTR